MALPLFLNVFEVRTVRLHTSFMCRTRILLSELIALILLMLTRLAQQLSDFMHSTSLPAGYVVRLLEQLKAT